MQAIITTYRPATNANNPRMHAKCAGGSVSIEMPAGDHDAAHRAACAALQAKMAATGGEHWLAPMVGGCLPSGQWAFVFTGE